jgi:hypothetical protein
VFLKGDGKGGFKSVKMEESNFYSSGAVRDIKVIRTPKAKMLLIAKNNNKIQLVQYR